MKLKLVATAVAFICCNGLINAQIQEGSTLIGGNFSFQSKKIDSAGKSNSGLAFLKVGRAFSDNVVWGLFGVYSGSKTRSSQSAAYSKGSTYGIGIFNRLYKPLGHDFFLFGESGLGYYHYKTTLIETDKTPTIDQVSLGFSPGISYKILDWAHIELSLPNLLAINYTKVKPVFGDSYSKSNSFDVSTSLSSGKLDVLGLGFSILF